MKQLTLDLTESKTAPLSLRVQPSLLAVFTQRCASVSTGPVDVSDMVRRLMAKWVMETKQGEML